MLFRQDKIFSLPALTLSLKILDTKNMLYNIENIIQYIIPPRNVDDLVLYYIYMEDSPPPSSICR